MLAQETAALQGATRFETVHDGRRTVWHAWGEGKPLLLLHGGSGSWTHWIRNVQALAAAARKVFVPDIPGFGDSEPATQARDADGVVEPLAAGLREIGAGARWDIAAFSFGGIVATLLAAQHPDLVNRLVLVAPGGLGIRDMRIKLRSPRGVTDTAELEKISRANLASLMLHREESITQTALALQTANVARDRMRDRRLALTDVVARTLPQLSCPIDVMVGDHDQLYSTIADKFDAVFTPLPGIGEIVRIPHAGHWVQYEEADAFNAGLARLLARHRPAPSR